MGYFDTVGGVNTMQSIEASLQTIATEAIRANNLKEKELALKDEELKLKELELAMLRGRA